MKGNYLKFQYVYSLWCVSWLVIDDFKTVPVFYQRLHLKIVVTLQITIK